MEDEEGCRKDVTARGTRRVINNIGIISRDGRQHKLLQYVALARCTSAAALDVAAAVVVVEKKTHFKLPARKLKCERIKMRS